MWAKLTLLRRIASYQEVAASFPSNPALERIMRKKQNNEEWREEFNKELGDLFRIEFHRVVLDEAHAIKTRGTQSGLFQFPERDQASHTNFFLYPLQLPLLAANSAPSIDGQSRERQSTTGSMVRQSFGLGPS